MGLAGRIKNPFTIVVAETFNTTHRIRSYDPMALRLIQKVSVLFSLRHTAWQQQWAADTAYDTTEEAQSITTSFMHLSLLPPSFPAP